MLRNIRYAIARIGLVFGLLLGAASALAQPVDPAPGPVAPPPAAASAQAPASNLTDGYILGPGDVVEISVLGREEFHPRVQVQVDGTIQLPYLHSVKAADLTVIQLRTEVTRLLREGGYYTDPVVSVSVVSYASRYVTVLGEFGTPGLIPVDRAYRVSEILARAGGARATAGDDILLRRSSGEELRLPIADVARGGIEQDPFVQPGDKLYLPAAPIFYVYGQVGAPGAYKVESGMTVRMAIARGGGLTERGSMGKISIYRQGKKLKPDLDMQVTKDDTIFVGERFF
jgi:polysaccharide export outer membrane protein